MTRSQLVGHIFEKRSFLCVGLDTDPSLIPAHYLSLSDPVFEFNKAVIDSTLDHCVAYKINIAFYECLGPKGWVSLEKTMEYIPKSHFTIADAKRGDIGNTAAKYASTFFDYLGFDAVTVAPYMGRDSVIPFLEYTGKWTIVLGLTSNPGSEDFQYLRSDSGLHFFEEVISRTSAWGTPENLMFVAGATHPSELSNIRKIIPGHFLLVPGVGAQGGSLSDVITYGKTADIGLLINSSRDIIYRMAGGSHTKAVRERAQEVHTEMLTYF